MGKIYVGQSFTIKLDTGKDITGATAVKIKYSKPDNEKGEWNADIVDAVAGTIKCDVLPADNTKSGGLTFWAKIIDAGGLPLIGEPSSVQIYNEGL